MTTKGQAAVKGVEDSVFPIRPLKVDEASVEPTMVSAQRQVSYPK